MTDANVSVGNVTTGVPDLAYTTESIQQSSRLGLTWDRRMGTITRVASSASQNNPVAIIDGDTAEVLVINMTGRSVAPGMRVFIDTVPPANNYVVAIASDIATHADASTSSTATITTETVVHTINGVTIYPEAAYRIRVGQSIIAATSAFGTFRVRDTNIAGAIIAESPAFPGGGLILVDAQWTGYMAKRTGSAVQVKTFVLTMFSGSGASFSGDADTPRFFEIEYCGAADDFPHACAIV